MDNVSDNVPDNAPDNGRDADPRFCKGPYLVGGGGTSFLPTADWERSWGSASPAIGCTNLRCGECGAKVRSFAKAAILMASRFDIRALYEAADFRALAFMREDPASPSRMYLCRCAYQFVVGWEDISALAERGGRTLRWSCQGHPLPTFPLQLDEFLIVPNMDFPGLLRSVLPSYWPAPLPPLSCDVQGLWVARLYKLLPDQASRRWLGRSVAQILTSDEPELWPGVLHFFTLLPRAYGAELLAELSLPQLMQLTERPDPRDPNLSLADRLFQVLALRAQKRPRDAEAVKVLLGALLSGRSEPGLLTALGRERALLGSYAPQIIAAAPHLMDELIYLLRWERPGRLLPILRALVRIPGVTLPAVRAQVEAVIAEPTREAILAALT